jgi:hypothetical protein
VLGGLCRAAKACPKLTVVIDHCGGAVGPRCFDALPHKRAEWEQVAAPLRSAPPAPTHPPMADHHEPSVQPCIATPLAVQGILALAECPNVFCKVGGLTMETNGFPLGSRHRPGRGSISSEELLPLLRPYLEFVIRAFGAERWVLQLQQPLLPSPCET